MAFKEDLAKKAETKGNVKGGKQAVAQKQETLMDMIKTMEPEIKRALPSVITPERFTRMALSAVSNNPKLQECTQMSFLAALMNAAQLGLEPNTPLGQAYLIPYENKRAGVMECQFQIGYKGMIDLVYRNEQVQTIQAQIVYENDFFDYELGLDAKLIHKPTLQERGEMKLVYSLFKLKNGGYGFEVLSKKEIVHHAERYSAGLNSSYSPWRTNFEEMAKKTAIKKMMKFAPLKADVLRALATDETIKTELAADMTEINGELLLEKEFPENNHVIESFSTIRKLEQ